MLNLPFFLAGRYLAGANKGAFTFVTRLAVWATALSVAVMILSLAVVSGFEETVKQKLYSFSGHVHVTQFSPSSEFSRSSPPIYADTGLLNVLKTCPQVRQGFFFAERPVILRANGVMEGIRLKGVDSTYRFPESIGLAGSYLTYPDSGYSREIIVSDGTASRMGVKAGDTVQLAFFENGMAPRLRKVRISGLYHSGMEEVDKYYAVCDIRLIQRLNNWSADSVNAYQLDLYDEIYADTLAAFIHYNLIDPPLEVYTTASNYAGIFDWLQLQHVNGIVLLVIMAVVAIINMSTVLLILMVDRVAMAGLLKALGMTPRSTARIFVYVGGILGAAGIALGNILAIGLVLLQQHFRFITLPEETYYMKYAPVKLVWWHVAATDIVSLLLLTLCMWVPAQYVRSIQPVKALQFR